MPDPLEPEARKAVQQECTHDCWEIGYDLILHCLWCLKSIELPESIYGNLDLDGRDDVVKGIWIAYGQKEELAKALRGEA